MNYPLIHFFGKKNHTVSQEHSYDFSATGHKSSVLEDWNMECKITVTDGKSERIERADEES